MVEHVREGRGGAPVGCLPALALFLQCAEAHVGSARPIDLAM